MINTDPTFKRIEKVLFVVVLGLSLIPVISTKYFPTLDGPAHLYNASLIKELVLSEPSKLDVHFRLNDAIVPNWSGHLLLSVLLMFLPVFLAEKVLLLTICLGLPLVFRSLVRTIAPEGILFSYLIFPMVGSFILYAGFYNFLLALILLFGTVRFHLTNKGNYASGRTKGVMILLLLLTFFSHVFIFAILVMILFGEWIWAAYQKRGSALIRDLDIRRQFRTMVGVVAIPMLLFLFYLLKKRPSAHTSFIEDQELFQWLLNLRPLIVFNVEWESPYTSAMAIVHGVLVLCVLVLRIIRRWSHGPSVPSDRSSGGIWAAITLMFLVLYFVLPDSDAVAGFFSIRLGLLLFLFLVLWLSTQKIPTVVALPSVAIVLYATFQLNMIYVKVSGEMSAWVEQSEEFTKVIRPYDTVLPLNYSGNWLFGHLSNYLGSMQPMVMLENYEAGTGYFPVVWQDDLPNMVLGDRGHHDLHCVYWETNVNAPPRAIDHVLVLGDLEHQTDSCSQALGSIILQNYTLSHGTANLKLYTLNEHAR